MFCEKCGTQNADDAKFCENCGNPFNNAGTDNGFVAENPVEAEATAAPDMFQQVNNTADAGVTPDFNEAQAPMNDAAGNQMMNDQMMNNQMMNNQMMNNQMAGGQMPPKKKSPVKLIVGIAAGAVALIAAIITIILLIVNAKPTIDLNEFVVLNAEGYDGYGYVSLSVDWDAITEKYGEDLKFTGDAKDKFGSMLELADPVDALQGYITIEIDKKSILDYYKNGDKITFKWKVKKEATKYVKCNLEYKNGEKTVEGLKAVEKFDAFEGVTMEAYGVSGSGYVSFDFDNAPISTYDYTWERLYDLKNGDKVVIKLSNEEPSYYINEYNKVPEELSKEFTVEGLKEYISSTSDISSDFLDELKKVAEDKLEEEINDCDEDMIFTEPEYLGYFFGYTDDASDNDIVLMYSSEVTCETEKFAPTKMYFPVSIQELVKEGEEYSYYDYINILGYTYLDGSYRTPGHTSLVKAYFRYTKNFSSMPNHEVVGFDKLFDSLDFVTKVADIDDESAKAISDDAILKIENLIKNEYPSYSVDSSISKGLCLMFRDDYEDTELEKNGCLAVIETTISSTDASFNTTTVYIPVMYWGVFKAGDGKVYAGDYYSICYQETELGNGNYVNGYSSIEELYNDYTEMYNEYDIQKSEGLE